MTKATVHLFVFDTMSDWEYGHLVAGINNPQFQKSPGKFKVKTVSLSEKPVVSIGGLRVTADMTLNRLKPTNSAMLVLPGGVAWDKKKNKEAAAQTGYNGLSHYRDEPAVVEPLTHNDSAGVLIDTWPVV